MRVLRRARGITDACPVPERRDRLRPLISAYEHSARLLFRKLGNTEEAMPHFMIRWQFTSTSSKALVTKPHDRTGAAKALVEGFRGKLHSYFLALGEYD